MTDDYIVVPSPRVWARAEIMAYCERTGRDPALFLDPAPPPNPPLDIVARMAQAAVSDLCAVLGADDGAHGHG